MSYTNLDLIKEFSDRFVGDKYDVSPGLEQYVISGFLRRCRSDYEDRLNSVVRATVGEIEKKLRGLGYLVLSDKRGEDIYFLWDGIILCASPSIGGANYELEFSRVSAIDEWQLKSPPFTDPLSAHEYLELRTDLLKVYPPPLEESASSKRQLTVLDLWKSFIPSFAGDNFTLTHEQVLRALRSFVSSLDDEFEHDSRINNTRFRVMATLDEMKEYMRRKGFIHVVLEGFDSIYFISDGVPLGISHNRSTDDFLEPYGLMRSDLDAEPFEEKISAHDFMELLLDARSMYGKPVREIGVTESLPLTEASAYTNWDLLRSFSGSFEGGSYDSPNPLEREEAFKELDGVISSHFGVGHRGASGNYYDATLREVTLYLRDRGYVVMEAFEKTSYCLVGDVLFNLVSSLIRISEPGSGSMKETGPFFYFYPSSSQRSTFPPFSNPLSAHEFLEKIRSVEENGGKRVGVLESSSGIPTWAEIFEQFSPYISDGIYTPPGELEISSSFRKLELELGRLGFTRGSEFVVGGILGSHRVKSFEYPIDKVTSVLLSEGYPIFAEGSSYYYLLFEGSIYYLVEEETENGLETEVAPLKGVVTVTGFKKFNTRPTAHEYMEIIRKQGSSESLTESVPQKTYLELFKYFSPNISDDGYSPPDPYPDFGLVKRFIGALGDFDPPVDLHILDELLKSPVGSFDRVLKRLDEKGFLHTPFQGDNNLGRVFILFEERLLEFSKYRETYRRKLIEELYIGCPGKMNSTYPQFKDFLNPLSAHEFMEKKLDASRIYGRPSSLGESLSTSSLNLPEHELTLVPRGQKNPSDCHSSLIFPDGTNIAIRGYESHEIVLERNRDYFGIPQGRFFEAEEVFKKFGLIRFRDLGGSSVFQLPDTKKSTFDLAEEFSKSQGSSKSSLHFPYMGVYYRWKPTGPGWFDRFKEKEFMDDDFTFLRESSDPKSLWDVLSDLVPGLNNDAYSTYGISRWPIREKLQKMGAEFKRSEFGDGFEGVWLFESEKDIRGMFEKEGYFVRHPGGNTWYLLYETVIWAFTNRLENTFWVREAKPRAVQHLKSDLQGVKLSQHDYLEMMLDYRARYTTSPLEESFSDTPISRAMSAVASLKLSFGDELQSYVAPYPDEENPGLILHHLRAKKGAPEGLGTKFMNALCEVADENGLYIFLTPGSPDKGSPVTDFKNTTSTRRLERFYKRFGFERNAKSGAYYLPQAWHRAPKGGVKHVDESIGLSIPKTNFDLVLRFCNYISEDGRFDTPISPTDDPELKSYISSLGVLWDGPGERYFTYKGSDLPSKLKSSDYLVLGGSSLLYIFHRSGFYTLSFKNGSYSLTRHFSGILDRGYSVFSRLTGFSSHDWLELNLRLSKRFGGSRISESFSSVQRTMLDVVKAVSPNFRSPDIYKPKIGEVLNGLGLDSTFGNGTLFSRTKISTKEAERELRDAGYLVIDSGSKGTREFKWLVLENAIFEFGDHYHDVTGSSFYLLDPTDIPDFEKEISGIHLSEHDYLETLLDLRPKYPRMVTESSPLSEGSGKTEFDVLRTFCSHAYEDGTFDIPAGYSGPVSTLNSEMSSLGYSNLSTVRNYPTFGTKSIIIYKKLLSRGYMVFPIEDDGSSFYLYLEGSIFMVYPTGIHGDMDGTEFEVSFEASGWDEELSSPLSAHEFLEKVRGLRPRYGDPIPLIESSTPGPYTILDVVKVSWPDIENSSLPSKPYRDVLDSLMTEIGIPLEEVERKSLYETSLTLEDARERISRTNHLTFPTQSKYFDYLVIGDLVFEFGTATSYGVYFTPNFGSLNLKYFLQDAVKVKLSAHEFMELQLKYRKKESLAESSPQKTMLDVFGAFIDVENYRLASGPNVLDSVYNFLRTFVEVSRKPHRSGHLHSSLLVSQGVGEFERSMKSRDILYLNPFPDLPSPHSFIFLWDGMVFYATGGGSDFEVYPVEEGDDFDFDFRADAENIRLSNHEYLELVMKFSMTYGRPTLESSSGYTSFDLFAELLPKVKERKYSSEGYLPLYRDLFSLMESASPSSFLTGMSEEDFKGLIRNLRERFLVLHSAKYDTYYIVYENLIFDFYLNNLNEIKLSVVLESFVNVPGNMDVIFSDHISAHDFLETVRRYR